MSSSQHVDQNRRRFLGTLGAAGVGLSYALHDQKVSAQEKTSNAKPLIDSPPVLQCPSENAVTVAWAVNGSVTGQIEFGMKKDRLDRIAYGDTFGMKPYHDRFLHIRMDALEPNTRYYYRTATCPMEVRGYNNYKRGDWIFSDVYSFETSGRKTNAASFCVINDTHNKTPVLKLLTDRIAKEGCDYTVWNGDLVDQFQNPEMAVSAILHPAGATFAAEKPMLFISGNHECRGSWARNLPLAVPTWPIESPLDSKLGRNFVVRKGPLALIGLDTGEDKPDDHPEYGGLNHFGPYRVAQQNWLEQALKSPKVSTAPFVVAFCHIPLFNPGREETAAEIHARGGAYQRQAFELWGPLLSRHEVQLLVSGHLHTFRYDPPSGERTWGQLIGGGCNAKSGPVTLIRGKADGDSLEVIVDELVQNKELNRWKFGKRKTS